MVTAFIKQVILSTLVSFALAHCTINAMQPSKKISSTSKKSKKRKRTSTHTTQARKKHQTLTTNETTQQQNNICHLCNTSINDKAVIDTTSCCNKTVHGTCIEKECKKPTCQLKRIGKEHYITRQNRSSSSSSTSSSSQVDLHGRTEWSSSSSSNDDKKLMIDNMSILPQVLLTLIFSFFTNATELAQFQRISKIIYYAIHHVPALSFVFGQHQTHLLNDQNLRIDHITQHYTQLQSLKAINLASVFVNDAFITQLAPRLKKLIVSACNALQNPTIQGEKLQEINLRRTRVGDNVINNLCNDAPQLEKLYLYNCNLKNPTIHGEHLQEVDLNSTNVGDNVITYLCNHTPQLEMLDLLNCDALQNPKIHGKKLQEVNLGWTQVGDNVITDLCDKAPQLVRLNLHGCNALQNPTIHGDHLQEINLGRTPIGDNVINDLCNNAPQLVWLDLQGCNALQNPTIHGDHLQEINLGRTKITEEAVTHLLEHCPQLRRLDLRDCFRLLRPEFIPALRTQYPHVAITT